MNCYLYLIGSSWLHGYAVKVGISADPQKRLATLQIGNPAKLELLDAFGPFPRIPLWELEQQLHAQMQDARLMGEWFCVPSKREALRIVMAATKLVQAGHNA
jgi:hypothetical protein